MPFKQGINFRSTLSYVTDGPDEYAQVVSTVNYPTTTPQGANVGYEVTGSIYQVNRSTTVDPRLAGLHYANAAHNPQYRIDLPAVGEYEVRVALGDATNNNRVNADLYDGDDFVVVLAADRSISSGTFADATDVLRSAAAWPTDNVEYGHTFASTIMRVSLVPATSPLGNRTWAHFYVEEVGGGGDPATIPVFRNHYINQGFA
jgi:hypothetical protein